MHYIIIFFSDETKKKNIPRTLRNVGENREQREERAKASPGTPSGPQALQKKKGGMSFLFWPRTTTFSEFFSRSSREAWGGQTKTQYNTQKGEYKNVCFGYVPLCHKEAREWNGKRGGKK